MEKQLKFKYNIPVIDIPLADIKLEVDKIQLKDYVINITISQKKEKSVKPKVVKIK